MDLISAWHLWIIAGFVAMALEVKLSGFVCFWFAVGAFATAIAAALGFGLAGQLFLFTLVSVALFAASRTLFQRFFVRDAPSVKVGAEAMLGAEAVVVEALPASGSGAVRINGELWGARSVDGPIAAGEIVQVASVDGLKLTVRRSQQLPVVLESGKERK